MKRLGSNGIVLMTGGFHKIIHDVVMANNMAFVFLASVEDAEEFINNHDLKFVVCDEKSWLEKSIDPAIFLEKATEKLPATKFVVISPDKSNKLSAFGTVIGDPVSNITSFENAIGTYQLGQ